MSRNYLIASVMVSALTVGFVLRDSLFSTTDEDLKLEKRLYSAVGLTDPMPGKNYVHRVSLAHFEPVSICSKNLTDTKNNDITISGYNVVGVNYNKAIGVMAFLLSEDAIKWLRVKSPEKVWELFVDQEPENGKFGEPCWVKIATELEDTDVNIFTVVNVYYTSGKPSLVLFKSKPVVDTRCQDDIACRKGVTLESLLPDDWATIAKSPIMSFTSG